MAPLPSEKPDQPAASTAANSVHGDVHGISLQSSVIHGDVNQHAPRPSPTSLSSLPPLPPAFTGRTAELELIHERLRPSAQDGRPVVAVVTGMGGVGKSALATVAAHRALERDLFQGAMWINLHGYSQDRQPVDAGQALDTLLRALGVDTADLPVDMEEKSQLYRSRLAAVSQKLGGPLLVIADNAAQVSQVAPLVPGPGGNRLLVTSRRALTSASLQGSRQISLDNLGSEESAALLHSLLGTADPEDPRLNDEGIPGLAELCCGLPLALKITVGQMIRSRRLTPTNLAERLARTIRVDRLKDEEHVLTQVFDLSYRDLTREQARVFVLLGLALGPSISQWALHGYTAIKDEEELLDVLDDLSAAHMVVHHADSDRWSMHDLLTDYVRAKKVWTKGEFVGRQSPEEALSGLLDYYSLSTAFASSTLWPESPEEFPGLQMFSSPESAWSWLMNEQDVLVEAVHMADAIGHGNGTTVIPISIARFLQKERRFADLLTVSEIARARFEADEEKQLELAALDQTGIALNETRDFTAALTAHTRCRDLAIELDDRAATATSWDNMGRSLAELRRYEEAASAHQRAQIIYSGIGDLHGEQSAWSNLGVTRQMAGDLNGAMLAHEHAVTLARHMGEPKREVQAQSHIANCLTSSGHPEQAMPLHLEALAWFRETGDRPREATELGALGDTLLAMSRTGEALDCFHRSRQLFESLGDDHRLAMIWESTGLVMHANGDSDGAVSALRKARTLFAQVKDLHRLAVVLHRLGEVLEHLELFQEATEALREATGLFERIDPVGGLPAWNLLGLTFLDVHAGEDAFHSFVRALELAEEVGDKRHEALALMGLGSVLRSARLFPEALDAYARAHSLASAEGFQHIAAPAEEIVLSIMEQLRSSAGPAHE